MGIPQPTESRLTANSTRHWLLIHDGNRYSLTWGDGERLLAIASAAKEGSLAPQHFTFTPRDSIADRVSVTVFVDASHPFELLTQYDAIASHWFG